MDPVKYNQFVGTNIMISIVGGLAIIAIIVLISNYGFRRKRRGADKTL